MRNMRMLATVLFVAVLAMAIPAQAQVSDPAAAQQKDVTVTGKITSIDLANGTLTLDSGEQFTLSQSFEYTSFPTVGQDVQVTYDEQGGEKRAHSVELVQRGDGQQ